MIFPRPSNLCGYCNIEDNCSCVCHLKDYTNNKHYRITDEEMPGKVKPVKDLEHFRD